MLPHIRRYRPALAAAAFAAILAGGAVAAPAAFADPPGVNVVQTTQGVAGYFANDNGMTRFRDVQADTTVTNQVKNLDGTNNTTNPGGVGVELCDPNSGIAAQLGLEWDGTNFVVKYGEGNLGNTTTSDPCVMTGLITNPTPQQLLTNFHISAGDHLHFEIFWQPHGFHFFKFNVCDTTLDVCRQAIVHTGFLNLYEAGIGAVTNSVTLTAPPANPLVTFTGTKFNYYSSTTAWNSIFVPAHWKLDRADFVNNSDQPVMSSNGGLNTAGTTFPLLEGSTSA
jgi:uncharacterized membrane protein